MKEEIWKNIPGYEGLYCVSDAGRVKRLQRRVKHSKKFYAIRPEIILKSVDTNGYRVVGLIKKGIAKVCKIHRIVMLTFIGPSNLSVNHINAIKHDNRLDNLEYCTHKENSAHAVKHNLTAKGSRNGCSKLNESKVANIIKDLKTNRTHQQIAKDYSCSRQAVTSINNNKSWRHVKR